MDTVIRPIAHIHSDFKTKFGIPRQSGLVELTAEIVFEPEFRDINALRGLEGFSHIWLIWQFSQALRSGWSPTVRPPRLGGNVRMGVFATRSPFRPNSLGLSCVELVDILEDDPASPRLLVSGADLMDGTPIFDIKPYIPYADAHSDARCGFAPPPEDTALQVDFPRELLAKVAPDKRAGLIGVLEQDPRPRYQDAPERIYGMAFGPYELRFRVEGNVLEVVDVLPAGE
ncbi:MAG: tRNA (N6-threonylcarbamoyladenosine(37)-N6)-methyltransferase TrmO [Candidatus Heteroscillospira sp.]|jgi:tRNA-Thr(GGU) m(6)t(6)A37 methyltransferase TsaA